MTVLVLPRLINLLLEVKEEKRPLHFHGKNHWGFLPVFSNYSGCGCRHARGPLDLVQLQRPPLPFHVTFWTFGGSHRTNEWAHVL